MLRRFFSFVSALFNRSESSVDEGDKQQLPLGPDSADVVIPQFNDKEMAPATPFKIGKLLGLKNDEQEKATYLENLDKLIEESNSKLKQSLQDVLQSLEAVKTKTTEAMKFANDAMDMIQKTREKQVVSFNDIVFSLLHDEYSAEIKERLLNKIIDSYETNLTAIQDEITEVVKKLGTYSSNLSESRIVDRLEVIYLDYCKKTLEFLEDKRQFTNGFSYGKSLHNLNPQS